MDTSLRLLFEILTASGVCLIQWSGATGNIQAAIKFLKVERLYRLGLATKPQCEAMLCSFNWDVELAASRMLDTM